jgi:hypothetical protein
MMKSLLKGPWIVFFVAAAFLLISSCATAPPAKEEAKAEPAKKEEAKPAAPAAKPLTPEDATFEDGVLTRTNAPAFTLEIPEGYKPGKPETPGQIFTASRGSSPWTVIVAIGDLDGDLKAAAQAVADGYVAWAKNVINTKRVEVLSIEPIDLYDEFEAMQIEMEYIHTDGSTLLTILHHVIAKGDKTITMSAWLMGDPDQAVSIYETIDLDP